VPSESSTCTATPDPGTTPAGSVRSSSRGLPPASAAMNTSSSLVSKVVSVSAPTKVFGSAYCRAVMAPEPEPYTVPATPAVVLLAGWVPNPTTFR
jgi:hypothetical protein